MKTLILAVLLLTGCVTASNYAWVNESKSAQQQHKDMYECEKDMREIGDNTALPELSDFWEKCLKAKGYKKVQSTPSSQGNSLTRIGNALQGKSTLQGAQGYQATIDP